MIPEKILKLKKYLFLISILLFVTSISHLIYTFLYHDAKLEAIPGGRVSEGLIGSIPSLNPLIGLNGNNKYMIGLLYRSLLSYNIAEEKIDSDLASCDMSNLLYIECFLKDNIYFSDGTAITKDDVIATYKLLQNTNINPVIQSILSETIIESTDNTITFSNEKKDLNFINVLFQPIVAKQIIDSLGEKELEGSFSTIDQVYSGDFNIINIEQNISLGITKLVLEKNAYSENKNIFIDQFEIKFFPDTNNFLKNKDTVNIFNDKNNLLGNSIPRFQTYQYTLPQYVSLFINQNKVTNPVLRNIILDTIDEESIIKKLGDANYSPVKNPYLNEFDINSPTDENIETILNKLGYKKKSKLISSYMPSKDFSTYSNEATGVQTQTGSEVEADTIPTDITIEDYQKNSEIIIEPIYIDKYNAITQDDILLKGVAQSNTTAVYINDYKLQSYNSGDRFFYYRLKETYDNIGVGENLYKIYFEINGEKILKEEITILYNPNNVALQKLEQTLVEKLYIEENKQKKEIIKPIIITEENKNENEEKINMLSELDDSYFYNNDLESFNLTLYYLSTESDMEKTALMIKDDLEDLGIRIILRPITLSELSNVLVNKDEYDMILAGLNLGYFDSNIFHYFHSSQAKSGYNFSNTRRTSLDIILEDLKSSIIEDEKQVINKSNVLKILKDEGVIKTLYTPKIYLLVDKNIKNTEFKNYIPNKDIRYKILNNAYIKEKNIINFENKGFITFIKFLYSKFNEQ